MEWLQWLSGTLFVQHPTRLVFSFQLCKKQRLHAMLIFALAWTTQHSGHNPGSKCTITWVPFPESPWIPITVFQSCDGSQPLMTSNLLVAVLLMDWVSCQGQNCYLCKDWCQVWRLGLRTINKLSQPTSFSSYYWEQCRNILLVLIH